VTLQVSTEYSYDIYGVVAYPYGIDRIPIRVIVFYVDYDRLVELLDSVYENPWLPLTILQVLQGRTCASWVSTVLGLKRRILTPCPISFQKEISKGMSHAPSAAQKTM
jgi:hypothetical protein